MVAPSTRIKTPDDFRELARAALEHCDGNPDQATKYIEDALLGDPVGTAVALRVVLRSWVGDLARQPYRTYNRTDPTTTPPVPDFHVGAPAHRQPRVYVDADGVRRTSPKQAGLRDWYAAKLNTTVNVDGRRDGAYKKLSECTADDLCRMATVRDAKAEENRVWAEKYRTLADAVTELGDNAVVRQLDPETGKKILKDA